MYLPFGPFFVVFGNILSDPSAWTVDQDLELLRTTVAYFESMCSQLSLLSKLSSRLAHTAGVFVQLAQHHVDGASAKASAAQSSGDLDDLDLATIESYLEWLPADTIDGLPSLKSATKPDAAVGARSSSQTSAEPQRAHSGDVFDWFSWDAYYSDLRD